MTSDRWIKTTWWLAFGTAGLAALLMQAPCRAGTSQRVLKYYHVEGGAFSFHPDAVWDTYESHGRGRAGGHAVLGLGYHDEFRQFSVRTHIRQKDKRLLVEVSVIPKGSDTTTQPDAFELELTDLKARNLKLAENDDGRVYMLNLTPSIRIVDTTPKRVDESAFDYGRWAFPGSIVVVNDELYVGKMGMTGGPLAFLDISGIGKFEFALKPFHDARLLGTLKDGNVRIESEDGTRVDIYNVKNGVHEMQLPGGPYEVWVRRSPPSEAEEFTVPSQEEWIQQVKTDYAEADRPSPSDEELRQRYEQFSSKRHHIALRCGVGPIRPADRVD